MKKAPTDSSRKKSADLNDSNSLPTRFSAGGNFRGLDEEAFFEKIQILQNEYSGYDLSIRQLTYYAATTAYHMAVLIHPSDNLWNRFKANPFWNNKRSRLNRNHCLRYCLMYLYGAHEGALANQARDHARALKPLWDAEIDSNAVLKQLRDNGGFDNLGEDRSPLSDLDRKTTMQRRVVHVPLRLAKFIDKLDLSNVAAVDIVIRRSKNGRRMLVLRKKQTNTKATDVASPVRPSSRMRS